MPSLFFSSIWFSCAGSTITFSAVLNTPSGFSWVFFLGGRPVFPDTVSRCRVAPTPLKSKPNSRAKVLPITHTHTHRPVRSGVLTRIQQRRAHRKAGTLGPPVCLAILSISVATEDWEEITPRLISASLVCVWMPKHSKSFGTHAKADLCRRKHEVSLQECSSLLCLADQWTEYLKYFFPRSQFEEDLFKNGSSQK